MVERKETVFDYNSKADSRIAIYFSIRRCTLRRRFLAILSHTTSRAVVTLTIVTQLPVSPNWITPPFSVFLPRIYILHLRDGNLSIVRENPPRVRSFIDEERMRLDLFYLISTRNEWPRAIYKLSSLGHDERRKTNRCPSIENPSVLFERSTVVHRSISIGIVTTSAFTLTIHLNLSRFFTFSDRWNLSIRYVLIKSSSPFLASGKKLLFRHSLFLNQSRSSGIAAGIFAAKFESAIRNAGHERDGKDQGRCFLVPGRGMHLSRQLRRSSPTQLLSRLSLYFSIDLRCKIGESRFLDGLLFELRETTSRRRELWPPRESY